MVTTTTASGRRRDAQREDRGKSGHWLAIGSSVDPAAAIRLLGRRRTAPTSQRRHRRRRRRRHRRRRQGDGARVGSLLSCPFLALSLSRARARAWHIDSSNRGRNSGEISRVAGHHQERNGGQRTQRENFKRVGEMTSSVIGLAKPSNWVFYLSEKTRQVLIECSESRSVDVLINTLILSAMINRRWSCDCFDPSQFMNLLWLRWFFQSSRAVLHIVRGTWIHRTGIAQMAISSQYVSRSFPIKK